MSESISAIVRQLSQDAEAISSEVSDLPGTISMLVKHAAERQIDPYVTLGVLVESIAYTIIRSIPKQKQTEAAKGVAHVLLDRLAAHGLIH